MNSHIKILYIDSDYKYAKECLHYFIENGYNIKYIDSIKNALIEYSFNKPDLIIFDESIQDGSGLSFIKKLKKYNDEFKTILFAEETTQDTLVEALSLKIDKFVSKSKSFNSLENDIKSLNIINKDHNIEESSLLFDLGKNFIYEEQTYKIIKDSQTIQLTNQENELISTLIKADGEYVATSFLLNSIGTYGETSIETLRTVIKKIRKKTYNGIIENQSGVGYKITLIKDIDINTQPNIINNITLKNKILVVSGNKKNSNEFSYQLSKFGFQCENAYTIGQAKELLEYESYSYIISQLELPDGDGIDFIRYLEDLKNSKVIILSHSPDLHYKEYLYFKGILDYIIDINDLKYLAYNIYNTIHKVEMNTKHNNILVIERSKRICEQIKDLLLPRNYNVDILNDIDKAYEVIKTNHYNLVLLDIGYQESFELISNVKYNINKSLPFIMLTETNRSYDMVREAYKNGASECLRKPIFAEEFILKVDQFIDQSKLVSQLLEEKSLMNSYQQIVDKTTIVSKTDKRGIITYVNKMFCDISGYSAEELIGKPHSIIRHPDTAKTIFEDMWRVIKEEKKVWRGIVKNRKKDGSEYIVQTYIMPMLDTDDEIVEFIALRSDITKLYKTKD